MRSVEPRLNSRPTWVFRWLALLVAGNLGCNGAAQIPHVDGTWTGTVREVKAVHARTGDVYAVAGVEIDAGPPMPEGHAVSDDLGGGRLPVIVRTWDRPLLVLDAKDAPIGRRVRVKGRMLVASLVSVEIPRTATTFEEHHAVSRAARPKKGAPEHVIVLREPLKVIDE